jgi:hypothetical protein
MVDFLRGPDDAKLDRALRRLDRPIPGFVLEAEPRELAEAVDVVALLAAVVRETGDDLAVIHAALARDPCRIKVMTGDEIEAIAQALGTTTGLPGGACARGLFLPPRLILVPRLDWARLIAHELVHLCQFVMGRTVSESEAGRVEDAVS